MVVNTDWSVEQYRTRFEPEDHWNLKVEFIEAHKSLIEEERLVCLAQVYVNMELLGCRYTSPVMLQVKELSKGLGADYKEQQQGRLKRTFVGAQDAAGAKARRDKGGPKFQKGF